MRVVDRALRLLDVLAERGDSVGVTQLSEQLGVPASTLHRLLGVLVRHGLVVQETASRRYGLGPGVLRLAQSYLQGNLLVSAAQPFLASLRSRLQETVFLTALVGDDAICVASAESPRPLQFYMRIGQRMPYHAAASARAILAYRSPEEITRALGQEALERFTRATHTTAGEVRAELARVRAQGYAVCAEEMEVGITAVSAPVRDRSGTAIASVTVVAPSERLAGAQQSLAAAAVRATADAISEALGYASRQNGFAGGVAAVASQSARERY